MLGWRRERGGTPAFTFFALSTWSSGSPRSGSARLLMRLTACVAIVSPSFTACLTMGQSSNVKSLVTSRACKSQLRPISNFSTFAASSVVASGNLQSWELTCRRQEHGCRSLAPLTIHRRLGKMSMPRSHVHHAHSSRLLVLQCLPMFQRLNSRQFMSHTREHPSFAPG